MTEEEKRAAETYRRGPVIMRGQMIPRDTTVSHLLQPETDTAWLHTDPWRVLRIQAEFVDGFGALAELGPAVAVLGSARTAPDDPMYANAQQVGGLLAERGVATMTGGGPGIMEAANRGAFEALTLVQTHKAPERPVVLIGSEYWRGLVEWLRGTVAGCGNISPLDPELFCVTDDVKEAVAVACAGIATR